MNWDNKSFHSLDYELKSRFGQKVIKLSLDGGFSCPNRDGTIDTRGCLFCGETGSGEFVAPISLDIKEQIEYQINILSSKWKTGKYIAYFQNFTNTYANVGVLKKKYDEALSVEGVVGLAIATRPDCLSSDILGLLETYNKKTYLWLELGLQTMHERTANIIRRGYNLECFEKVLKDLNERGIKTVVHLIAGLPGEDKKDFLESVKYISTKNIWGLKLHLLYVQKGTDLEWFHNEGKLSYMDIYDYAEIITDALELIPGDVVIHRLTGDGKKELLIEPKWSLKKFEVLTEIDNELKRRKSYQGIKVSGD